MRFRALSYNIHKGFTAGNTEFALHGIRDAIRETGSDLVFLQEVLGRHDLKAVEVQAKGGLWPTEPQFEFLADSVWNHHAYGRNAVYESGHHGNAVLSAFPIRASHNIDISPNRFESRGFLHTVLDWNGRELHAICLHLGLWGWDRKVQVNEICERIRSEVPAGAPLIMAGDFNDWRTRLSEALQERAGLTEAFVHCHGRHARTFPSRVPLLRLDRIYFRGLRCTGARIWSGFRLSDHLPISADFEF